MEYESTTVNGFRVIRFRHDLGLQSNISDLREEINKYIQLGDTRFALHFSKGTFLYTRTIAVLVQCFEMIRGSGGTLSIVEPNEDIIYTLNTMGFLNFVSVIPSIESLEVLS